MTHLTIGKQIGPYRVLEKIGHGGMGVVYKGVHTKLEQEVAIKALSPRFSQDPPMRERFVKEAKIQAKFSHPNVVNVLNYIEDEGNTFLIMEYVNGETLENRLKGEGKLPVGEAFAISFSVLKALDFMHSKGIIHRDIKPGNIMLTDGGTVKVTDFGIAKAMGERGQTRTGMTGTFRYMSPEQILGEETSTASDVYSFGVTLYEMVTGRVPFDGDSEYKIIKGHLEEKPPPPWEINSKISKRLGRVILRALSKNPKDRYRNVREFKEYLRISVTKSKDLKVPSPIINAWSQKISYLNLGKKWYLIPICLGIFFLLVIFISILSTPKPVITSYTLTPNTESIQPTLDLGLYIPPPEDITSEYILTRLEGGTEEERQMLKTSAKKRKKYFPKSRVYNANSNHRASTRETNERAELEEVLRKSFLLPRP